MINKKLSLGNKVLWVYVICSCVIALNCIFIIKEFWWGMLLPVLVLLAYLFFFKLDILLLLIPLSTPLAINIRDFDMGFGISLPTEPILFGILILFFIKLLWDHKFDRKILKHPVTIAIIFSLLWMFITSLTSSMPLVSFKYLIARLWFVVPVFLIGTQVFKKFDNIKLFSWLYVSTLIIVIAYTIYNHAQFNFNEKAGHFVMTPFYNDHTAYGAILAFFIPVFLGFSFNRKYKKRTRFASMIVFVILVIAIVLSFCRAAWVSLALALIVYFIIILKIKLRWVVLSIGALVGAFYVFQFEIFNALEKNKQGSSANFVEHIESITNISSDPSNLERINRWQSAFRMYSERPFWGWGPGTYQFVYAPFQRAREKTIISTNAGDLGNSHSEYFGPLSEEGMLGMLAFLGIVITVISTGMRVYKRTKDKEIKLLSLITLLALITYFIHGMMNNFLDTDKASVPFWGFIAILVALDVYHNQKSDKKITENKPELPDEISER